MSSRLIVRMMAPLVAMSVLLLVVGVGAAWYVHHLQSRVSDDLKANVSSLRAAEELVIALNEIRTLLDHFRNRVCPSLLSLPLLRHNLGIVAIPA